MPVFGTPIEEIMARDGEEKVPSIVKKALCYLNTQPFVEGYFRVSPGVREVESLKEKVNSGGAISFDGYDPHLVAGLLKVYFIDLPEPLLTFDLYDKFIEVADTSDIIPNLKNLFQELPETNKLTAACLFRFLCRVVKEESHSSMTTNNLAIVFGQILLRPRVESLVSLLRHSPKITLLLKCLIENYDQIIPASPDEERIINELINPPKKAKPTSASLSGSGEGKLTPEQQKLKNIKLSVEDSITVVLDRLDEMSKELSSTTSLEETIEIAKRVRTAKRFLFSKENEGKQSS